MRSAQKKPPTFARGTFQIMKDSQEDFLNYASITECILPTAPFAPLMSMKNK
jgi:hypothetical protein